MRAEDAGRLAAALAAALALVTPCLVECAVAPGDSSRVQGPPASAIRAASSLDTTQATARRPIDMTVERKLGVASLEEALRLRRPVLLGALPLFGPTQGSLAVPDAGSPIRLDGWIHAAERSTDEQLIGSYTLGWGAPWLAFALSDSRADAAEMLDVDSIEVFSDPGAFRGPGEELARPVPRGPAFRPVAGDTSRAVTRTTLVYRKGSGDAQLTGARFQTTTFRRALYASYTRNQANGWAPLDRTLSQRYALRAELGRVAAHRLDLEGLLYERTIRDSVGGSSEWDTRHVAVNAAREGARSSDRWRVRLGSAKETWVLSQDVDLSPVPDSRERWEFPTVSAEGAVSWRPSSAMTWIGAVEAASRKIVYRADSLPAFTPRRGDARVHLGSRYALGASTGVGIDAAYDVREAQPGFWDARGSIWGSAAGTRGRIDLESAHERPSWVDLLTPATLHTFGSPVDFVVTEIARSGNPALRPRRLTGALASLGATPIRGLDLELTGSYRRVTHDFGWDVAVDTTGGFYRVSSTAVERGSGWLSHVGIGWEFRRGAIHSRGVGWVRGGPDSLSPQSGSPPRRALDLGVDLGVVLFHGDLPLRFGVESHARGPRRGLIREAAQVTWDGTLSADFGPAGIFARLRDVFDARPGSAIWDPTAPAGAPSPGRAFQAGVAWNLLD